MPSLEEAFNDLASAATLVCQGAKASSRAPALTAESHQAIAEAVESTAQFQALALAAIQTMPEYRDHDQASLKAVVEQGSRGRYLRLEHFDIDDARWCVLRFLRRSGFYLDLWRGEGTKTAERSRALEAALAEGEPTLTELVPLDGLSIRSDEEIDLGAVRLVKLSSDQWHRFFETREFYRAPLPPEDLSHLWCLRQESKHKGRSLGHPFDFLSPRGRVMQEVGRWIYFVNLWGLGSVRPVALFQRIESLLDHEPVHARIVAEPVQEVMAPMDDEDQESYRPLETVEVEDVAAFREFLVGLNDGYEAASADGRVATALRSFDRTCDDLFGIRHKDVCDLLEEETLEDIVADACTCLEAALLNGIRDSKKGATLARRTAALVASNPAEEAALIAEVESAYALRNFIVHGDVRQPATVVAEAARNLIVRIRQVLTALLMLKGDRGAFERAVQDPGERATLRAHFRAYIA